MKSAIWRIIRTLVSLDFSDAAVPEWNAPPFFYTDKLKPFDPKEYKGYIVVFNLYQKDCIRLVFPSAAKIKDRSGLLQGDYEDGRRLAFFGNLKDVQSQRRALQQGIKTWLARLEK